MWSEAGWLYAACNATTMPYMHAVPLISIHVDSNRIEQSHTQLFLFFLFCLSEILVKTGPGPGVPGDIGHKKPGLCTTN